VSTQSHGDDELHGHILPAEFVLSSHESLDEFPVQEAVGTIASFLHHDFLALTFIAWARLTPG
jgi:hypothetical protein